MARKENLPHNICTLLSGLTLKEKIEILANVLILEGLPLFDLRVAELTNITPEKLIPLVIKQKQQHGETLPLAMVHQGLTMLMWLNPNRDN
jgi:hypothetical protein